MPVAANAHRAEGAEGERRAAIRLGPGVPLSAPGGMALRRAQERDRAVGGGSPSVCPCECAGVCT